MKLVNLDLGAWESVLDTPQTSATATGCVMIKLMEMDLAHVCLDLLALPASLHVLPDVSLEDLAIKVMMACAPATPVDLEQIVLVCVLARTEPAATTELTVTVAVGARTTFTACFAINHAIATAKRAMTESTELGPVPVMKASMGPAVLEFATVPMASSATMEPVGMELVIAMARGCSAMDAKLLVPVVLVSQLVFLKEPVTMERMELACAHVTVELLELLVTPRVLDSLEMSVVGMEFARMTVLGMQFAIVWLVALAVIAVKFALVEMELMLVEGPVVVLAMMELMGPECAPALTLLGDQTALEIVLVERRTSVLVVESVTLSLAFACATLVFGVATALPLVWRIVDLLDVLERLVYVSCLERTMMMVMRQLSCLSLFLKRLLSLELEFLVGLCCV